MSTKDEKQAAQQRPQVLLGKGDSPTGSHLQSLLPKIGYQVVVSNDGLEARNVLLKKEDTPQLAVLDANMAGLTAIDLCRELRGTRLQHFTYIIVFSSWNEKLG